MTVSKYDFSVYEKRILYCLVEAMQCELEGKKLHLGLRIEKNIYDDRVVMMPISSFLANDDDENYTRVKKALIALRNKTFEFDDGTYKHYRKTTIRLQKGLGQIWDTAGNI